LKREISNSLILAIGVILLAVGGPWMVRQLRTLPQPRALADRSEQRIVTLAVGGMTCAGCAAKVKSELGQVAGVSTVEVRLEQQRAYIVCDKAVADTALTGAVHRAGPGYLATLAPQ
jgi:copper chaperone